MVGYIFGVVGVVYAVVLAFVVVTAWQEQDHAEQVVLDEQNAISSLFTIFYSYEDADVVRNVREDLRTYAHSMWADWYLMGRGDLVALARADVTKKEPCGTKRPAQAWPLDGSAAERSGGDAGARAADCIAADIVDWAPNALYEQADYAASLSILQRFLDSRAGRIHHSNERLPTIMWASLIGGAIVILVFTFLFAEQTSLSQVIRTAALSAVIGIMFAQALVFDHPFIGPNRVDASRWKDLACEFDEKLGNRPCFPWPP